MDLVFWEGTAIGQLNDPNSGVLNKPSLTQTHPTDSFHRMGLLFCLLLPEDAILGKYSILVCGPLHRVLPRVLLRTGLFLFPSGTTGQNIYLQISISIHGGQF